MGKNGEIKFFFQGEPTRVPTSKLPCLVISKSVSEASYLDNATDEHNLELNIIVIADVRKDLSTSENDSGLVEGIATLYDILEGRNSDYTLKSTSILNILRNNQLLDVSNNLRTDLKSITQVSYGETLRDRNAEQWTLEARIKIVATFHQIR